MYQLYFVNKIQNYVTYLSSQRASKYLPCGFIFFNYFLWCSIGNVANKRFGNIFQKTSHSTAILLIPCLCEQSRSVEQKILRYLFYVKPFVYMHPVFT